MTPDGGETSTRGDDELVATAMEHARPDDAVGEATALAELKRGLFEDVARAGPIVLSRYVLLHRIGAGGLGVVFAAYDPSLDRKVAIKLLQDRLFVGENEPQARGRLAREAQAIAKLAHPNVVAVHDVGSYELPRPIEGLQSRGLFVVMEHVDGDDLDTWVMAEPRSWRAIVRVYVDAGRGLEAAHRAGLVHRDFKPSNVMVGLGRARVLDFGLARSHGASQDVSPRNDASLLASPITLDGRVIGTPAYMSPEQHERGVADARSDQFAFCVALWESLLRQRPFAGAKIADLASAKRAGQIVPPPPRTSVPPALLRVLERGMAADPAARWPDMAALLAAIERIAGRRRHVRWGLIGIAAGAGITALFASRVPDPRPLCSDFETVAAELWNDETSAAIASAFAASRRPHAVASHVAIDRSLDAYTAEWIRRRRESCEAAFVRRDASAETTSRTALCLDEHLARAEELIAILRSADADVVDRATAAVDALPAWTECDRAASDATPRADERDQTLERALLRAESLLETAEPAEALAVAEATRIEANRGGWIATRAHAELVVARVHARAGRIPEAYEAYYAAQASAELAGDERTATAATLGIASTALEAADAPLAQRALSLGEAKIQRHELGRGFAFESQYLRARVARLRGRLDEAVQAGLDAVATAEAHFTPGHLAFGRAHALLGALYFDRGDTDRAEQESRVSLEIYESRLGPDHPDVADLVESLASVEAQHGRAEQALAGYRRTLAIRERVWGHGNHRVALAVGNIAMALQTLGRTEEALAESQRTVDMLVAARGENHPETAVACSNLANVLLDVGRLDDAREMALRAQRGFTEGVGEEHPHFAYALATEGIALTAMERPDDATGVLTRARELLALRIGDDASALPIVDKALADAELAAGRIDAASKHVARSLEGMRRSAHDPRDLVRSLLMQAVLPGERHRDEIGLAELREAWLAAGLAERELDTQLANLREQVARAQRVSGSSDR